MKNFKIIDRIPLKNTLVLSDKNNRSIKYLKLQYQDKVSNYTIGKNIKFKTKGE